MSYDIYFWRQAEHLQLSPEQVLSHLGREDGHPDVEHFSREQVAEAFRENFPDLQESDQGFTWEGSGSYFELFFGFGPDLRVFYLSLCCGYQLVNNSPESMNLIIHSGNRLGYALYDPQTNERYEQPARAATNEENKT